AIGKATLRGVESEGMLCSARELGLSEDQSGLYLLDRSARPGTPLATALDLVDTIFEVNVTPNRPDALSHLGIAREVAAAAGKALRPPRWRLSQKDPPAARALAVRIEAPDRCFRYAARVVEGVRIGPAPVWLRRRLESCGVRSISNAVDATNFALLELGHPLHAFDLDKVAGALIVVRAARAGETMATLDGVTRSLVPEDLVIADRDRPSALAGVMGGGDSEISAGTSRILLESAWFQPQGVRRTARRHGLHTEASHRFERGADPGMVVPALDRCAALIAELCGGTVRRGVVDAYPRRHRPVRVSLDWKSPARILGMPVSRRQARSVLEALGFEVLRSSARGAVLRVPSWRRDVSREEDLVEEIVRHGGYHAIPETLPSAASETPGPSREAVVTERVRQALEAAGFCEAVNFSFVAPQDLDRLGPGGAGPGIALKNPISAELAVMRTSLLPSLLRNAAFNQRQRVDDVRLYELASVYHPRPAGFPADAPAREDLRLGGVMLGRRHPPGWAVGREAVDFHDLKAALEGVMAGAGVEAVEWVPGGEPWLHPRAAASLAAAGPDGGREVLGSAGEVHPRVAAAFDLPPGALAFELSFPGLVRLASLLPAHREVPRFPAVLRDLAVVVAEAVSAGMVVASVREEPLVEAVTLFDVYRGPPLPEGKKNLALAIRYRAAERTLTDAEADEAHARIVARLRADPGVRAELRA
ncbi:MAG TPA: phenylalanine--tRNA ligase subunit beta, partial [Anaeromyxobacteraceae bacterium]|nr:phenylalanine--tRNA ligase subunit beta [Anaeromyxobacteraceae bacterium]